jgi:hypothetical protein
MQKSCFIFCCWTAGERLSSFNVGIRVTRLAVRPRPSFHRGPETLSRAHDFQDPILSNTDGRDGG